MTEAFKYKNSCDVPWKLRNEGDQGGETYSGDGLRFSVDDAKALLAKVPHPLVPLDPKKWAHSSHFTGYKYGETKGSNLDIPVIVAQVRGRKYVLDGWHRITKAFHEKLPLLPSVHLTEKESTDLVKKKRKALSMSYLAKIEAKYEYHPEIDTILKEAQKIKTWSKDMQFHGLTALLAEQLFKTTYHDLDAQKMSAVYIMAAVLRDLV